MNVLIVSDNPASKSFLPILRLKEDMEELIRKQIDLIAFSSNGILLNQRLIRKESSLDAIRSTFEKIFEKKVYQVCIFSLTSEYLGRVFLGEWNLLNLINKNSPQAALFVFGASKMLNKLRTEHRTRSIFLFPRPGVAKLTREFRDKIIKYIKNSSLL